MKMEPDGGADMKTVGKKINGVLATARANTTSRTMMKQHHLW